VRGTDYKDYLALTDLAPETVDHVAACAGLTPITAVGLASRLAVTVEDERGEPVTPGKSDR
jgi:hypothetical protein